MDTHTIYELCQCPTCKRDDKRTDIMDLQPCKICNLDHCPQCMGMFGALVGGGSVCKSCIGIKLVINPADRDGLFNISTVPITRGG